MDVAIALGVAALAATVDASGSSCVDFRGGPNSNKPLPRLFRWLLTREAAQGCVVSIDFYKWATDEREVRTVPGRWSSHPEPLRAVPSPAAQAAPYTGGTAIIEPGYVPFTSVYDPRLIQREQDIAVTHGGEEGVRQMHLLRPLRQSQAVPVCHCPICLSRTSHRQ